jgi:hypothetical protein
MVEQIEAIMQDGKAYVFASRKYRTGLEAFASVTDQRNGTLLITDGTKGNVTAKMIVKSYDWKCIMDLDTFVH